MNANELAAFIDKVNKELDESTEPLFVSDNDYKALKSLTVFTSEGDRLFNVSVVGTPSDVAYIVRLVNTVQNKAFERGRSYGRKELATQFRNLMGAMELPEQPY